MQDLPVNAEDEDNASADDGRENRRRGRGRCENDARSSGSYYYDDAYGYEDYDPEEDEGSAEPEEQKD